MSSRECSFPRNCCETNWIVTTVNMGKTKQWQHCGWNVRKKLWKSKLTIQLSIVIFHYTLMLALNEGSIFMLIVRWEEASQPLLGISLAITIFSSRGIKIEFLWKIVQMVKIAWIRKWVAFRLLFSLLLLTFIQSGKKFQLNSRTCSAQLH